MQYRVISREGVQDKDERSSIRCDSLRVGLRANVLDVVRRRKTRERDSDFSPFYRFTVNPLIR